MALVLVVMGVSGSGKTSVGQALARRLACPFYDGDDYHPAANVARMAQGLPLTDANRRPWLARLHQLIREHVERGETAVVACSALKRAYRDQLRGDLDGVRFIYLQGSFELIQGRLADRTGHFMPAGLLASQFAALEEPGADEALIVAIDAGVPAVTATIYRQLRALSLV